MFTCCHYRQCLHVWWSLPRTSYLLPSSSPPIAEALGDHPCGRRVATRSPRCVLLRNPSRATFYHQITKKKKHSSLSIYHNHIWLKLPSHLLKCTVLPLECLVHPSITLHTSQKWKHLESQHQNLHERNHTNLSLNHFKWNNLTWRWRARGLPNIWMKNWMGRGKW